MFNYYLMKSALILTTPTEFVSDDWEKLKQIIRNISGFALTIVTFLATAYFAFYIVPNLFFYFQKGGDPQKKPEAKEKLTHAITGLAVVWVARFIIGMLLDLMTSASGITLGF